MLTLTVVPEQAGGRLDRALATAAAGHPGLSRSRLAQLIAGGAVTGPDGRPVAHQREKASAGAYTLNLPAPAPADPAPEAIPLAIAHEDDALIVIDKPAGMVVHPAPGAETGTLVNALIAHCGDTLSGIGGAARPGIVHRIDKDTSGLLVVAKSQAAHEHLSRQFAAHSVHRRYLALAWGAPDRADPRLAGLPGLTAEPGGLRIETRIDRHPTDRRRMAVSRSGRVAITRLAALERFGSPGRAIASLIACRLETGRTHQIRVHAAHIGHPLIGDPVYGRARRLPEGADPSLAQAVAALKRQALHAGELGFEHPDTGAPLRFESPLPQDLSTLLDMLRRIGGALR